MTQIQKAVQILDQVVPQYLEHMQTHQGDSEWIDTVFADQSNEARKHLKDSWQSQGVRFDDFYLNLDVKNQRAMLVAFGVDVAPDPYPSSSARVSAMLAGADPWECHPFETYILVLFLRFSIYNALDVAAELPKGAEALKKSNLKHRGNARNWGLFYQFLMARQYRALRVALLERIVTGE